jgi:hypothetical protein
VKYCVHGLQVKYCVHGLQVKEVLCAWSASGCE